MPHVDVVGQVKRFGALTAVDGLCLAVTAGEVHGFLGPNGAGKSTTIRTLLGLYRADAGTVTVLGGDPARNAASINRRVSYVAGDVAFWPNLTGSEVHDALAGLRGARRPGVEADLIERFGFDPDKKVRAYSKGNRQVESAPLDALRHLSATTVSVGGSPDQRLVEEVAKLGLTPSRSDRDGTVSWSVPRATVPPVLGVHAAGEVLRATITLSRLLLRRYRVPLLSWIIPIVTLTAVTVPSYASSYPDLSSRGPLVASLRSNQATTILYGHLPLPGSLGQLAQWEVGTYVVLLTAVMALTVTESMTRVDEETGRTEVVAAAGLGT